jgi:hypothetical protein
VQVVRHKAVGVDQEAVEFRFFSQSFDEPFGNRRIGENWGASFGTHRYEVPPLAAIFLPGQAMRLALEIGRCHRRFVLEPAGWALSGQFRWSGRCPPEKKGGRYNSLHRLLAVYSVTFGD